VLQFFITLASLLVAVSRSKSFHVLPLEKQKKKVFHVSSTEAHTGPDTSSLASWRTHSPVAAKANHTTAQLS
jgi:hypothetical protein